MRIVVISDSGSKDSFILRTLKIDSYGDLVLHGGNYLSSLKEILAEDERTIFVDSSTPIETLKDLHTTLQSLPKLNEIEEFRNIEVLVYDPRFFPVDPEQLRLVIGKCRHLESAAVFLNRQGGQSSRVAIFRTTLEEVHNGSQSLVPLTQSVNAHQVVLDELVIDLSDGPSSLNVFAGHFKVRHFNRLKNEGNSIVKSSTDKGKMSAEYNFLSSVPDTIKVFYPQVFNHKESERSGSYGIERIFSLSVSSLFVNRALKDPIDIARLIGQLRSYLEATPRRKVGLNMVNDKLRALFVTKNKERLAQLEKVSCIENLERIAALNGYGNLSELFSSVNAVVEEAISKNESDTLYFTHGDLCFSNILFSIDSGQLKLIDPRGFRASIDEAYLPREYDLAKLSHSFLGLYDLVLHEMAHLEFNDDLTVDLEYSLPAEELILIGSEFCKMIGDLGLNPRHLRAYEASLFSSMLPLHQDSPKRMAMLLTQCVRSLKDSKLQGRSQLKVSNDD